MCLNPELKMSGSFFLKKGSRNWVLPFRTIKTKITITTGAMSLYQQIIVNKVEGK